MHISDWDIMPCKFYMQLLTAEGSVLGFHMCVRMHLHACIHVSEESLGCVRVFHYRTYKMKHAETSAGDMPLLFKRPEKASVKKRR